MRTLKAFTLVEILATVTIMGIGAALIIPQMGQRGDLEVASAARNVVADLGLAQSEAVTRHMPVYVSFTSATGIGGSYSVYRALPSTYLTSPLTGSNWKTTFGLGAFNTIRLVSANLDSGTTLMFDETGAPFSVTSGGAPSPLNSGTITLRAKSVTMSVKIEPLTGALSVQ